MSSSDWEKDLEEWRESYKKNKSIKKIHDDIIQRREEETKILKKKLQQEAGEVNKRQENLYREDFNSLQLKKIKPWLMELLKNLPINSGNFTSIKSLTDVFMHTLSKNTRSESDVVRFKFGEVIKEVKPSLIFDTLKYFKKNSEILRAVVKFDPPTKQLVKDVGANASYVPGGGCDVCGHVFGNDPRPRYFPVLSTDDNQFWCCYLCKDVFYRYRYLKEKERAVTRARLLPMGVQPSLKL